MQVDFGGDEEFNASIEAVRNFVKNVEKVAACIPDSGNFSKKDDTHFTMNIEPGLGVVKGSLPLNCSLSTDGDAYTYLIDGKGLGSQVKVTLTINPYSKGGATGVKWKSVIEIKGIMGGIGEPVIRKITEEYVQKIITNAKQEISKS
jgi:carbon monoxide dehydrogenase subunit G